MSWTAERQARLAALAAAGKSARDIAAELGVSRNAVLGRCYRTGVKLLYEPDFAALANARRRSGPRRPPPPDAPIRRARRRGSSPFTLDERAAAVAARLAGASWRRAASLVGANFQTLRQNWMGDPAVMDAALATLQVAKREAFRARQERLAVLEFQRRMVAEHNERVLAKLDNRTATIARRRLSGESLAAIAADFGFTRERARQIFKKAIVAGLREPPGVSLLRDRPVKDVQARLTAKVHGALAGKPAPA